VTDHVNVTDGWKPVESAPRHAIDPFEVCVLADLQKYGTFQVDQGSISIVMSAKEMPEATHWRPLSKDMLREVRKMLRLLGATSQGRG
jgi:hypothetical protein